MSQKELIQKISPQDLRKNVLYSQVLFICITIILSFVIFDSMYDWFDLFKWDIKQIMILGVGSGLLIVLVEFILISIIPKHHFDDGGINEKIFKKCSTINIFFLTLIIAISEELLFRGLIQTVFGFWIATILFILMHTRYLLKPVLLILMILMSLFFGLLYEWTDNLAVTISTHFTIDFILGLFIRSYKWGSKYEE